MMVSAVHIASSRNNVDALRLLLTAPSLNILNHKDKNGATPVMRAITKNSSDCLSMLAADLRVDLNTTDNAERSIVHAAVENNNVESLTLLLNDPRVITFNHKRAGATAAMEAVIGNKFEILEALVADLRVDLDTTDMEGKSLEEMAR